jgi:hypothetical protein
MNWFNRPYPLVEETKTKLLIISGFGVFVSTFLYIYQPFGIASISEEYRLFYVLGIGLHIAFTLSLVYFLIPVLFKSIFMAEKWTIKNEIFYIVLAFFMVTCSNYLYNMLIGDGIAPYHNFIEFFGITVAVGIFPVMIMVFFVERNLSSKNIQKAEEYSQLLFKREAKKEKNTEITITPETTTTSNLVINYKDFVFATSDNNYSTIYFKEEGKLDNQLLRLTFKNLEEQLIEFSKIIRCHKSYMVNKNYISEVKGNARSLMLKVELYDKMIPVSRSFPKENLL